MIRNLTLPDLQLKSAESTPRLDAPNALPLSVIVPVCERDEQIEESIAEYVHALDQLAVAYELIFVLDGSHPKALQVATELRGTRSEVKLIELPRPFGEATAIALGADQALGEWLLILPPYRQVNSDDLSKLWAQDKTADMYVAVRADRVDGQINRFQTRLFSSMVSKISGLKLNDAGCNVRLLRRSVLQEVTLYGDFHRFLPILAHHQGFRVQEVTVRQSSADSTARLYAPGLYLRRLLDLLTVFFLFRFTKKPFRFFGLIGSAALLVGSLIAMWTVGERLFEGLPLANRPAFLFAMLFMVFGLQTLAVGLIGEIIIFAHARDLKEYSIRRIVETSGARPSEPDPD